MLPFANTPVAFISHGAGPAMFIKADPRSPFKDAAQGSEAERMFKALGETHEAFGIPSRPSALVVVSAHWETSEGVRILMNDNHKLFYDYYGFPQSTYEIEYPAPGPSRELAEKIQNLINGHPNAPKAKIETSGRGWDHGVFIPLKLIYPKADIPVVEISLDASLDPATHIELGRALRPLRKENVMIIGSGQSTHPMSRQGSPEQCDAFMTRLETALFTEHLEEGERVRAALHATRDDNLTRAMHNPTLEHLIPLLVCVGAGEVGEEVRSLFLKRMRFLGAFDLASYVWGPIGSSSAMSDSKAEL